MSDYVEKGSWKDSSWYVGLSGFWGEYRKHRSGVIGLTVLSLFVVMAIGAPIFALADPSPTNKVAPQFLAPAWMQVFDPEGVVTNEYMPDPHLNVNPNNTEQVGDDPVPNTVYINGTSPNFSYAYGDGHVNLTWTHHAGDQIWWKYPSQLDPNKPDANDFIMFTQVIHWDYDTMPSDVNMSLDIGVTLAGDFYNEPLGGRMFKFCIWLIDSSGNWQKIYDSEPPYQPGVQNRRIDLSWFDIKAGWLGMMEANGTQEDPKDILTVAMGLTPTDLFRQRRSPRNPYLHPWMNYTGSVTVQIETVSMIAYGPYYGLLGTTDKGGDAWAQLIYGSRISLTIGILATALSTAVGVIVGLVAGYFGGKIDEALMRIVDFLLVIPGLPLMMVLAAFLGPTIQNIIVVIAILGWTGTSRLIRSQVMAEKNKAYVESARAIGASDTYIIFRHILPNVTPILFANITLGVVAAILSESGLAFLGLTDPSQPSWGRMLADAQSAGGFSNGAWWVVVFPGMMITLLSLSFTFVGHTMDQVLNPRLRER